MGIRKQNYQGVAMKTIKYVVDHKPDVQDVIELEPVYFVKVVGVHANLKQWKEVQEIARQLIDVFVVDGKRNVGGSFEITVKSLDPFLLQSWVMHLRHNLREHMGLSIYFTN
jgi:hypothetical protein